MDIMDIFWTGTYFYDCVIDNITMKLIVYLVACLLFAIIDLCWMLEKL